MPMYDFYCDCGFCDSMICSVSSRDAQPCPECGRTLNRDKAYASTGLRGPTDTNPSDYGQGLTFTSPAAERKYFADHPEAKPVSKTDSAFRNRMDRISDIREKKAKKMGFRDLNDQQAGWRKGITQK